MRKYRIRLKRIGLWKKPIYHIVVTFSDVKSNGLIFEKLGLYNPSHNKIVFMNLERISFWLLKNASISKRTIFLLSCLINSKK